MGLQVPPFENPLEHITVIRNKACLESEGFLTLNMPITKVLKNMRTTMGLDKDFSLFDGDADGCDSEKEENNVT